MGRVNLTGFLSHGALPTVSLVDRGVQKPTMSAKRRKLQAAYHDGARCAESPVQCWALDRCFSQYPLFDRNTVSLILDLATNSVPVVKLVPTKDTIETEIWAQADLTAGPAPRWVTGPGQLERIQGSPLLYQPLLPIHQCSRCGVRGANLPDIYPVGPRRVPFRCCYCCGLWVCLECEPDNNDWCCPECETIPFRYCRVCQRPLRYRDEFGRCPRCGYSYCCAHDRGHVCSRSSQNCVQQ